MDKQGFGIISLVTINSINSTQRDVFGRKSELKLICKKILNRVCIKHPCRLEKEMLENI